MTEIPISRDNNFGFLRLLFASLVMVSHSAELIDGNRSREALIFLTGGKLTFGDVAVDGFFIISGYLVLKSFENSDSVLAYLRKRIRRIYPGFLVSFLLCIFVVAPITGTNLSTIPAKVWFSNFVDALFLFGPHLNAPHIPAYPGLSAGALNGPMWSIPFEFRCYLVIIVLAAIGVYKRKWTLLILTTAFLLANEFQYEPKLPGLIKHVTGYPPFMIRLVPIFCVGGIFHLYREAIPLRATFAAIAAICLVTCLHLQFASETAIAIFGGYLIFWFALGFKSKTIAAINSETDISYGTYLYAWPVQCSLILFFHINSPWLLMAAASAVTVPIALTSWHFVEKPLLAMPKIFERPGPIDVSGNEIPGRPL